MGMRSTLERLGCPYVSLPDCWLADAIFVYGVVDAVEDSGGEMVIFASTSCAACTRPVPKRGMLLGRPPLVDFGGSPGGGRGLTEMDGTALMTEVDSRTSSPDSCDLKSVVARTSPAPASTASLFDPCDYRRLCRRRGRRERKARPLTHTAVCNVWAEPSAVRSKDNMAKTLCSRSCPQPHAPAHQCDLIHLSVPFLARTQPTIRVLPCPWTHHFATHTVPASLLHSPLRTPRHRKNPLRSHRQSPPSHRTTPHSRSLPLDGSAVTLRRPS